VERVVAQRDEPILQIYGGVSSFSKEARRGEESSLGKA
jgi:hypothetical protein